MGTALITGASSGIGLEFAHVFASKKHNLVLVSEEKERLEVLSKELIATYSISCEVIVADLRNAQEIERVFEECSRKKLTVDFLVNNAGVGDYGLFVEGTWERMESAIDLNVKAITKLCRSFLPGMIARKSGHILNIASTAAFQPGPLMAVYYATKSYVLFLSEALHSELQGTGVQVTCLCPGPTSTPFIRTAHMTRSNLFKDRKLASAREVAEFGYSAVMKNKMTVIHGWRNFLLANCVRLVPRKWVLQIVRRVQRQV